MTESIAMEMACNDMDRPAEAKPPLPKKFWEVEQCFKCPLAGMGLTFQEQKQLLKKAGMLVKGAGAFDIHEALVVSGDDENQLSRRLDGLLNRKFGKKAADYHSLDETSFMQSFREAFEKGDYMDILWAAATHRFLSKSACREIFGAVHMAMHWSGEERSRLLRMADMLSRDLAASREGERDAVRARRSAMKELEGLKRERDLARATAEALEKETSILKALAAGRSEQKREDPPKEQPPQPKEEVLRLEETLEEWRCRAKELEAENNTLRTEQDHWQRRQDRLEQEFHAHRDEVLAMNHCDSTCPSFDLCQKRILIVGGITKMEARYRELIEGKGGLFDYHDGYMRKSPKGLESRLKRADLVLCPVNCNSHAACALVKKLAKKHNKTLHMLASSSLNAIDQVICGGQCAGAVIQKEYQQN